MLKYTNEEKKIIGGRAIIIKRGKPLDGKHVFRNAEAQKLFDKFRSRNDIADYGIDDANCIYFQFLNGNIERYGRRDFIRAAKEAAEWNGNY